MHTPLFSSGCTSNRACTSAVGACTSNHREKIAGHKCVSKLCFWSCKCCCAAVLSVKCVNGSVLLTVCQHIPLESVSNVTCTSLSAWAPMVLAFLIVGEWLRNTEICFSRLHANQHVKRAFVLSGWCDECTSNSQNTCTHTYLHSLQNVFPMEYALFSWVLEGLHVIRL